MNHNLRLYLNMISGKLCSAQVQAYIHEDDNLDAMSDTKSMDILANSSAAWLKNIRRRSGDVSGLSEYLLSHLPH